jgi:2-polyprenyl-3-methyl-5-hydroxy-6-metoxy-1,4-benzoquinol methylase
MALHVWGEDSQAMMSGFEPTDALLMKYENNIVNCQRAIRGSRVLDMGCNHGLYSYMAMRHGASRVVGVEPRGMFVDGLNKFAGQNDLAMEFHRGYDTDLPRLVRQHSIDTVMLMGVDDIINWESMMYDIRKSDVADHASDHGA